MDADSCPDYDCDDPKYTKPVVVPPLPENMEEGGQGSVTLLIEDDKGNNVTIPKSEWDGIKHDVENLVELLEPQSKKALTRSQNLPLQVVYSVRSSDTEYNADNVLINLIVKDLQTNGDASIALKLNPATPSKGEGNGKSGIMSGFQATQLAALAAAYEAEEKGTTLYEGTASTNNIELSESGFTYDHLVIVTEYMGMGSFALKQQAPVIYYPDPQTKAFQIDGIDITTGNTPTVEIVQDIWSMTDDGMELELSSALKGMVNSETTVEPQFTSHFTITKVVGFGKKLIGE